VGKLFLQEIQATVVVAHLRDFAPLSRQLGPVELGLALSRFYEHVGAIVEGEHGRLVKFTGDGVLSVFVGGGSIDHAGRALAAVRESLTSRQAYLDDNAAGGLPILDYVFGAASGNLLAGELGTEKLRSYDVLGQPVNQAFRIAALANRRGVPSLVDAATYEGVRDPASRPAAIETDAVEMDGDKLRLFKLEA
jgi:adenylate cyclase